MRFATITLVFVAILLVDAASAANFITQDDYPAEALRKRWEGEVEVAFSFGAEGKVHDCAVRKSSGHDVLDVRTCALIERRFRYDLGKEGQGPRLGETRTLKFKWRLPR